MELSIYDSVWYLVNCLPVLCIPVSEKGRVGGLYSLALGKSKVPRGWQGNRPGVIQAQGGGGPERSVSISRGIFTLLLASGCQIIWFVFVMWNLRMHIKKKKMWIFPDIWYITYKPKALSLLVHRLLVDDMTFLGLHADWSAPQFSNLWSGHGGSPLGPTQCNRLPCFHASYPCPGETLLCVFKYYPRSLFMPGKNCVHMGHLLIPQNIRCFMFAFSLIPARVLVRIGSISDKIPGFRQHTTSPRTGRQAQQKLGGFAGPWWP